MAITTLDGALAGMNAQAGLYYGWHKMQIAAELAEALGVWHNLCYTPGQPGNSVMPSTAIGLNGETLTTRSGAFPFTNPLSGNTYLTLYSMVCSANFNHSSILIDRLWHNHLTPGANTTATALASITGMSTLPARDAVGSTAGYMVGVAVEVYSTTGNGSAITNMSITYTNSDGTSGRSGSIPSFPATAQKGTFVPFTLQAGDKGVRSIQAWTQGTSLASGNIGLVCFRQIAKSYQSLAGQGVKSSILKTGNVRLYDNTVLECLVMPGSTPAQTNFFGELGFSQG